MVSKTCGPKLLISGSEVRVLVHPPIKSLHWTPDSERTSGFRLCPTFEAGLTSQAACKVGIASISAAFSRLDPPTSSDALRWHSPGQRARVATGRRVIYGQTMSAAICGKIELPRGFAATRIDATK